MTTEVAPTSEPNETARVGIDDLVHRLRQEFPTSSEQRIRTVVLAAHGSYRDVKIRTYVLVFVEREARQALTAIRSVPEPRSSPLLEAQEPDR